MILYNVILLRSIAWIIRYLQLYIFFWVFFYSSYIYIYIYIYNFSISLTLSPIKCDFSLSLSLSLSHSFILFCYSTLDTLGWCILVLFFVSSLSHVLSLPLIVSVWVSSYIFWKVRIWVYIKIQFTLLCIWMYLSIIWVISIKFVMRFD